MTARILQGDCRASMGAIARRSVQTCITSPPYFGLRDYGTPGQLGLERTPTEYVANMVEVFRCVRECLADDGTLFLNLGDSYFGGGRGGGAEGSKQRTNVGALVKATKWSSVNERARRASPCGTSGIAPEDSTTHGCLCGSLCDACRRAYRIGKSRSDGPHAPMPAASPFASSRERKESSRGRLPTSGSTHQADHSAGATLGSQLGLDRGDVQPLGDLASTIDGSSQQHQEGFRPSAPLSECQLCGCSFERCVQAIADNSACTCDIASPSGASIDGKLGMASSGLAYADSTITTLKPKDMIGIPWRVAFALQADGWYLRQDIIWHKPNPMPESVRDRCTKAHEYLFLFAKSKRYYFDSAAMQEPAVEPRGPGNKRGYLVDGQRGGENANLGGSLHKIGPRETRNKRSVWTVATKPFKGAHFATFPVDLIEPCVLAGTRPGDLVLDPFGGAGTTAIAAQKHGRRAVLCELSADYVALADERIAKAAKAFASSPQGMLFERAAA